MNSRPNRNRPVFMLFFILSLWTALVLFREPAKSTATFRDQIQVMGTTAHIIIEPGPEMTTSPQAAAKAAFDAMEEVDRLMSTYKEMSDLSRLNRAAQGQPVTVDARTMEVLQEALRMWQDTGGAFDVTVGPLVRHYKKIVPLAHLPDNASLQPVRARVGSQHLLLDADRLTASFARQGMRADLGAIAKGYAVDRAMEVLQKHGVTDAMVEAGGELRLLGQARSDSSEAGEAIPAGGTAGSPAGSSRLWRIGICHPREPQVLALTLERTDCAVATSGDYLQFFELDGKRYSHIVDPRTGYPVQGGVVSVTVIHPTSCMVADALTTAVSVLGEDEGVALLKKIPGVEAILYVLDKDGKLKPEPIHLPVPQ